MHLFADELLDVHHDIEGTVRLVAADAGDAVHPLHHVVAAALKGQTHALHALLGSGQGLHRCLLRDGAGGAGAVAEIVGNDLGDLVVGGHIADPPAGHGVGLGDAVDEQGTLLDLLTQRGKADELGVVIDQAVIDLVGDDVDVLLHADLGQSLQLLPAVHGAGGVAGVVQDHALGLGGNGGGELLGGDLEFVSLGGMDDDRNAAHHADQLGIADPVRRGQDDLVPGIDKGAEGHIDTGLGAVGDGDLLEVVIQTAVCLQTGADGFAQLHSAAGGSIAGIVVVDGRVTGGLDVVRRGKIGLTGAEADDVLPLRLHLLEHGVDRHGSGGLHRQSNF